MIKFSIHWFQPAQNKCVAALFMLQQLQSLWIFLTTIKRCFENSSGDRQTKVKVKLNKTLLYLGKGNDIGHGLNIQQNQMQWTGYASLSVWEAYSTKLTSISISFANSDSRKSICICIPENAVKRWAKKNHEIQQIYRNATDMSEVSLCSSCQKVQYDHREL